jgi:uncharacterized protein YrrD
MIKFASEFRGKPVLLQKEKAVVGIVEDMIVNPDNGEFVGLLVREGFGKKNLKTLPEKDLVSITSGYFLISSYESLGELDEIVRLKTIIDLDIPITGTKTYTVSGKYLGKSRDYTLNMKSLRIDKIYVEPPILSGGMRELAIAFPQIISIEKDKITVEDAFIKIKAQVRGKLPKTAIS